MDEVASNKNHEQEQQEEQEHLHSTQQQQQPPSSSAGDNNDNNDLLSNLLKRIEFLEKKQQHKRSVSFDKDNEEEEQQQEEETAGLLQQANNNNNNNNTNNISSVISLDVVEKEGSGGGGGGGRHEQHPPANDDDEESAPLRRINNGGSKSSKTRGIISSRSLRIGGGGGGGGGGGVSSTKSITSTMREENEIEGRYDTYELPDSTYTLLITEKSILSLPFCTGIIASALSIYCLVIALINELDNGTLDNPYGIAEVDSAVRQAQFLGIIIGVLMDEEIPMGLELIGKGVEQKSSGGHKYSMKRIIFSSILRMTVGYLFLFCLFLTVIQESNVLDIFFDVLALEFVENLDDVIFELSKRGFFGRQLRIATNREHFIETDGKQKTRRFRKWTKRFVRVVYFTNAIVMIIGLIVIMQLQHQGQFRCESITVSFGDGVWESAWVRLKDTTCTIDEDCAYEAGHITQCHKGECYDQRLLIYSHFNGIYTEDGVVDERPRYIEMNKEDGDPFKATTPAEIRYCESLEAWVLVHPDIRTSLTRDSSDDGGNDVPECDWLLQSPRTESFDLVEMAEDRWRIWIGQIEQKYRIDVHCAECNTVADCNFHGKCVEREGLDHVCDCSDDYFGIHCQFERPCDVIRSEKDSETTLELLKDPNDDEVNFVEVYGRPMYQMTNLQGKPYEIMRLGYPDDDDAYYSIEHNNTEGGNVIAPHKHYDPDFFADDDDFFQINSKSPAFQDLMTNYSFIIRYTGRRWYGQIVEPGKITSTKFVEEEWHAFWNNAFSGIGQQDNATLIVSAPTTEGSPVGVDFYEMRRRNKVFEGGIHDYDYSPYGVLIPLASYKGTGFFHCNKP